MLIAFKQTELSYSSSKGIIHTYLKEAGKGESLDFYLKNVFKIKRKMKSEIKLNSEHLFELEENAIWGMQYVF